MALTINDLKGLETGLSWANALDATQARNDERARRDAELAAQQEEKRAAQARRYQGIQGYQQDVASGMTPLEAIRRHGADLYADNPQALISAETALRPVPQRPTATFSDETRTINGQPMMGRVNSLTHEFNPYPIPRPQQVSGAPRETEKERLMKLYLDPNYSPEAKNAAGIALGTIPKQIPSTVRWNIEEPAKPEESHVEGGKKFWLTDTRIPFTGSNVVDRAAQPARKGVVTEAFSNSNVPPRPQSTVKRSEVIRSFKGRPAVFDSATKEFIRYAD